MIEYKQPRVPETLKFEVKMYAELEQKECLQCKEVKSLKLFRSRIKKSKHLCYESYCKDCEKLNYKEWYKANRKTLKQRDYERNCLKFGLTAKQYEQMVKDQKGLCAVCKKPEIRTRSGKIKNLAIDHCHKTGVVRALLCGDCNTGLGLFKDDIKTILSAALFLKKFKK